MKPKITISQPSKLNGIRGFSLPPVLTCPYATEECKAYCYARHGRFQYANVKATMQQNYEASLRDDFVSRMDEEISPNERYFRIHVSGDFYSLEYYFQWSTIARRHPWVRFLAYTRNLEVLRFYHNNTPPENLVLIMSLDEGQNAPMGIRHAKIVSHKYKEWQHKQVVGFGVVSNSKLRLCNSDDCLKCLMCWDGTANIAFPQTYKKYSKTEVITE